MADEILDEQITRITANAGYTELETALFRAMYTAYRDVLDANRKLTVGDFAKALGQSFGAIGAHFLFATMPPSDDAKDEVLDYILASMQSTLERTLEANTGVSQ